MAKTTEIIRNKKAMLDVMEKLFSELDNIEEWETKEYKQVGLEDEQATDRNGNLLWEDEDETIPKYRAKYDYVEIPKNMLSDDSKAKLEAIEKIRTTLEKLV